MLTKVIARRARYSDHRRQSASLPLFQWPLQPVYKRTRCLLLSRNSFSTVNHRIEGLCTYSRGVPQSATLQVGAWPLRVRRTRHQPAHTYAQTHRQYCQVLLKFNFFQNRCIFPCSTFIARSDPLDSYDTAPSVSCVFWRNNWQEGRARRADRIN